MLTQWTSSRGRATVSFKHPSLQQELTPQTHPHSFQRVLSQSARAQTTGLVTGRHTQNKGSGPRLPVQRTDHWQRPSDRVEASFTTAEGAPPPARTSVVPVVRCVIERMSAGGPVLCSRRHTPHVKPGANGRRLLARWTSRREKGECVLQAALTTARADPPEAHHCPHSPLSRLARAQTRKLVMGRHTGTARTIRKRAAGPDCRPEDEPTAHSECLCLGIPHHSARCRPRCTPGAPALCYVTKGMWPV